MILISNLTLSINDGSTIASTEIYGTDKKTYINIGSGNVFKLYWETPTLTNDTVDRYRLVIRRHDITLNVYYDIFDKTIGLVNEFYVDAPLLPLVPAQYILSIYLVAYGKQGSVLTSNVINPYISKGSGTYVKVRPGDYAQPIMKRALGFAKIALAGATGETLVDPEGSILFPVDAPVYKTLADNSNLVLTDDSGKILTVANTFSMVRTTLSDSQNRDLKDANGLSLSATATKLLESTNGWTVVQEGYTKVPDDKGNVTWRTNDIKYEVLQVLNAQGKYEVLTFNNGTSDEPIYIL